MGNVYVGISSRKTRQLWGFVPKARDECSPARSAGVQGADKTSPGGTADNRRNLLVYAMSGLAPIHVAFWSCLGHTYSNNLYHVVFSTKQRHTFDANVRERLHAYIGGTARQNGCVALEVGGTTDHVHVMLRVPPTMAVSKAVQLIKTAASKWMHDECRHRAFEWQQGYAAFTVSESQRRKVAEYIRGQVEHHRQQRFEDEFLTLLRKHDISFDPKYVLG